MDRRRFIAVSAVGAVGTLAGCTGAAQEDGSQNSADSTRGAAPESAAERSIEVRANGEIETEPDEASMHVGLEVTGDSADEVETELAEQAEELRAAFEELGIPNDDVESGRYDVRPERDGTDYEGSHSFHLTIDDVDRVGDVVDGVTAVGADDVGRINFGLSDERRAELRDDTLAHALENADEEASSIAADRDVSITGTKSVSTRNVDVQPATADAPEADMQVAEDDTAAGTSTEIESGPVVVTASVEVAYGFEAID
ncbi:SIMPL domain-containing protein [Natrarchaeobaculum sulfurireducens]|uniref:Outer membrane protein n=1 Tax=Natrarchaeobaculum sulfurireducens TaxID=2044521 RepID=A0A346PID6_9EURY|nr:SIMPL domain-containing protein [Natrarchaeobaculum sulfurireducens]AXR79281.1 hypothetical protein AArc1_2973 [Natrarchaeobaculum sulfurireducens]